MSSLNVYGNKFNPFALNYRPTPYMIIYAERKNLKEEKIKDFHFKIN